MNLLGQRKISLGLCKIYIDSQQRIFVNIIEKISKLNYKYIKIYQ